MEKIGKEREQNHLELGEQVIAVIERIPRILDLELLENMVNVL